MFEGALISPSSFTIFHNAETVSAACSSSPWTKLPIFFSILVRITSVVSSIQVYASFSTYRFLISSYLRLYISEHSARKTHPTHLDANLLNDSSTISHFPSSPRMRFRARVFNAETSYCGKGVQNRLWVENRTQNGYRPCPRVGRWTSEMAGGLCLQNNRPCQRFAICDSLLTQTVRTLSHPCKDRPETLGTCDEVNGNPKVLLASTHVTYAISGIFTTFPFSTRSSWPSQTILSSPERSS